MKRRSNSAEAGHQGLMCRTLTSDGKIGEGNFQTSKCCTDEKVVERLTFGRETSNSESGWGAARVEIRHRRSPTAPRIVPQRSAGKKRNRRRTPKRKDAPIARCSGGSCRPSVSRVSRHKPDREHSGLSSLRAEKVTDRGFEMAPKCHGSPARSTNLFL